MSEFASTIAAEKRSLTKQRQQTGNPLLKFSIGAIACLSAVLSPNLIASLAPRNVNVDITFFPPRFVILALVFAFLVGLVVMILEWNVPRTPADTFMTTLGIPAILAGALSANQHVDTLQQNEESKDNLIRLLSQSAGIQIVSAGPTKSSRLLTPFLKHDVSWATVVYAEPREGHPQATWEQTSQFSVRVTQPQYWIVFGRDSDRQRASDKKAQLLGQITQRNGAQTLNLEVTKASDEFLIVAAGGARSKADALVTAVQIKNTFGLNPTLQQVSGTR